MIKAHTEEEFQTFMSQLVDTNATLGFYVDFDKCLDNVNKIEIKLNKLNYLIGKSNLNQAIRELWNENPKVFSVLDILIAIRTRDKKQAIGADGRTKFVSQFFESEDGVVEYIKETGLASLFMDKKITNLVDYVFGIEVGLDSNSRKNRSGHIMENTVAKILSRSDIEYNKEVKSTDFPEISKILGEDVKRFDFVVQTKCKTYLIEVNFYSSGGSKLNEVARAYTELAPKINSCPNYEFVWITDGVGWSSARNKLEEAFYVIPSIYNLTTCSDFIKKLK